MWSQQERMWWRKALGFAAIYKQSDPRLENALTAIQSLADGGTQSDSTSENEGRQLIQQFLQVRSALNNLWLQMQVSKTSGGNIIDALRGMLGLRLEGRRIVNEMSALISTNPRRDVFSSPYVNPDGDAFVTPGGNNSSNWG